MTILTTICAVLTLLYATTIILFLIGLRKKHPASNTAEPNVTVVVAARNEEQHLGKLLDDLCAQTWPRERLQIIIVDDGSTDRTAEIIQAYAEKHAFIIPVTIDACPPGFSPKKYALQNAVEHASGEIILATDADCRVGPDWIKGMVRHFLPDVGFVIGFSQYGRRGDPQNLIERLQAFDFIPLMGVAEGSCNLGLPLAASGQNLAYRRDAFLAVGGYKRIAGRVSGDDVLLLQLVRKYSSYRIVFASNQEAFASSAPQPTLRQFVNQRKRWASNGSFQIFLNIPFFAYLIMVHAYTSVLFIGIPLAVVLKQYTLVFFASMAIKALFEGLIAMVSARRFHREDLLIYFPLWFFLQIPYVALVGLLGTFGNFSWKDRNHSATI